MSSGDIQGRSRIIRGLAAVSAAALAATLTAGPASASEGGKLHEPEVWTQIVLEGGATAEFASTVTRIDDSQFPDDLEMGESVTLLENGEETTYHALTASCTISMTLSSPYVASGYAMTSFKFSTSLGCSGGDSAEAQLLRRQVLGSWKREAYAAKTMRAGLS